MSDDPVSVLGIRQAVVDPSGSGGQRRQIPRGCVVPNWKERLQIGRGRNVVGLYHAITTQTPSKFVVESQVFTAYFQVVPSERSRHVISNRLSVLKDVQRAGADRVATQNDDHGTSVQDRVIWKIGAFPPDRRLVLPLVIGKPAF